MLAWVINAELSVFPFPRCSWESTGFKEMHSIGSCIQIKFSFQGKKESGSSVTSKKPHEMWRKQPRSCSWRSLEEGLGAKIETHQGERMQDFCQALLRKSMITRGSFACRISGVLGERHVIRLNSVVSGLTDGLDGVKRDKCRERTQWLDGSQGLCRGGRSASFNTESNSLKR